MVFTKGASHKKYDKFLIFCLPPCLGKKCFIKFLYIAYLFNIILFRVVLCNTSTSDQCDIINPFFLLPCLFFSFFICVFKLLFVLKVLLHCWHRKVSGDDCWMFAADVFFLCLYYHLSLNDYLFYVYLNCRHQEVFSHKIHKYILWSSNVLHCYYYCDYSCVLSCCPSD